ncbi:MAG: alpha/beta fold hydrolase [Candidatus Bathyarchaeia archaeon]
MTEKRSFGNGVPYVRLGKGGKVLVVFSGGPGSFLPSGSLSRLSNEFKVLSESRAVYVMSRKSGLPEGYSTRDMAEDYAEVIKDEFEGGPVDVMGMSYGGLIAQHLAADHPELVRRLVLAMSAYRLCDGGKKVDMRFAELLSEGKKRAAFNALGPIINARGIKKRLLKSFMWLFGPLMLNKPENPSDLLVEGKAEVAHDSRNRLADIKAPTLIIGGDKDYYFPLDLYRETAAGIPNARLILREGKGHVIWGKQFEEDVLAFLCEEESGPSPK